LLLLVCYGGFCTFSFYPSRLTTKFGTTQGKVSLMLQFAASLDAFQDCKKDPSFKVEKPFRETQTIENKTVYIFLSICVEWIWVRWLHHGETEAPLCPPVDKIGFSSLYSSTSNGTTGCTVSYCLWHRLTNRRWDIIGGKQADRRSFFYVAWGVWSPTGYEYIK